MAAGGSVQWSTRFGFLMASVGFAVGLGNIWRFPYVTGENGGGAFVAVYLICVATIALPILMAELLIGRRGRMNPAGAMAAVAAAEGRSPRWGWVGGLNLAAAFVIEVVYCVVAGWVLHYLWQALITGFSGIGPAEATAQFGDLLGDLPTVLMWTLLALGVATLIIYGGVRNGIERAVNLLMPFLFGLLLLLAVHNLLAGGFGEALGYLFAPDFSKVNGPMILAAVGQAFFSVGVAMAGMMAFAAYLPKAASIGRSAVAIVSVDTLVALVAGLVIFPAVFRFGMDPAAGAGLIFETLPVAFAQMAGGRWVAVLFFLLLSVAAVTSASTFAAAAPVAGRSSPSNSAGDATCSRTSVSGRPLSRAVRYASWSSSLARCLPRRADRRFSSSWDPKSPMVSRLAAITPASTSMLAARSRARPSWASR